MESALDRSDPTAGHDDAWSYREDSGVTWVVASPLVRWALPFAAADLSQRCWDTTDASETAPFCLHGACWAPGGRWTEEGRLRDGDLGVVGRRDVGARAEGERQGEERARRIVRTQTRGEGWT